MSDEEFYFRFEDRFRGPRDVIKDRLKVYTPFVEPLRTAGPNQPVLDLGCGRGEWLELLKDEGFLCAGVDLDERMLSTCRGFGLDVTKADAISYLSELKSGTQYIVSAFHLVEHLRFDSVRELIQEALRVLKPGGLLILETPNPENLAVGTASFYLDPTHQKPLPAPLLSFVVEDAGFARVKTLYLNESKGQDVSDKPRLMSVINGASPDYAVVAQKKAPKALAMLFDSAFVRSYGVRLSTVADLYDQQAELRVTEANNHARWIQNEWDRAKQRVEDLSLQAGKLEAERDLQREKALKLEAECRVEQERAEWLQSEWDAAQTKIEELNQTSRHWCTVAGQLDQQLKAVYASYSWRIMAEFRAVWHFGERMLGLPVGILRGPGVLKQGVARRLLLKVMGQVLAEPATSTRAMAVLRKFPWLRRQLRGIALGAGLITSDGEPIATAAAVSRTQAPDNGLQERVASVLPNRQVAAGAEQVTLSRPAERIYSELRRAIETGNDACAS